MKKLIFLITAALLLAALASCNQSKEQVEESPAAVSTAESAAESTEISIEAESSFAESSQGSADASSPEHAYPFLESGYVVLSKKKSFGRLYSCEYYLVEGVVAGIKASTTLPDTATARDYYEHVLDDYPDAVLDKTTVITYSDDKDSPYFGYSLEKLLFYLDMGGYDIMIMFDDVEFYKEFPKEAE